MRTRPWIKIGLCALATAGAIGVPALSGDASAEAKDWHYEKSGRITGMSGQKLVLSVGTNAGVYVGSTGMIYRGSSEDFLTDSASAKIRFEITSVSADRAEARITHGKFSPVMLLLNRRVVLRAKNQLASKPPSATSSTSGAGLPKASELGQVCYPDGGSKPLTPEAMLWMAKMIHGETGGRPTQADATSMLWAIAQRSNIWGFKSWDWRKFIQAYSQPINPIWTRSGKKCSKYYASGYTGSIPDNCSEKRLLKRERYIALGWNDLHPLAQSSVVDFAQGKLQNSVPGVVGWFAPGVWRSLEKSGANQRDGKVLFAEIDGNAYYRHSKNPNTTSWTASTVRVVGPGQACR